MNPQTWTKVGANRFSRLTASPDFWMIDPLKPPSVSKGISTPRRIRRRQPNVVPIGPAVWQLPQTFEFVTPYPPPNAPLGYWGDMDLAYVHSQMNPFPCEFVHVQNLVPIGPAVSQILKTFECLTPNPPPPSTPLCLEGQFVWRISIPRWICRCVPNLVPIGPAVWQLPRLLNLWHPTPHAPGVLRGDLYLSYVHSQMNPQAWTKVGANRTASPHFWIVDPLKPPSAPSCLEGQFVWRMFIPLWMCTCVPNLVPIGPAVW